MAVAEKLVERLTEHGGLIEVPAAQTALEKRQKEADALEAQRSRLMPSVCIRIRGIKADEDSFLRPLGLLGLWQLDRHPDAAVLRVRVGGSVSRSHVQRSA